MTLASKAVIMPPAHFDNHFEARDPSKLFNPTKIAAEWNNDHKPHPEYWGVLQSYRVIN